MSIILYWPVRLIGKCPRCRRWHPRSILILFFSHFLKFIKRIIKLPAVQWSCQVIQWLEQIVPLFWACSLILGYIYLRCISWISLCHGQYLEVQHLMSVKSCNCSLAVLTLNRNVCRITWTYAECLGFVKCNVKIRHHNSILFHWIFQRFAFW